MKLIVGLGNPGKEYENTRHNVGFWCADELKEKFGFDDFKLQKKFFAMITQGTFNNEKIILAKPDTFMNLSGKAVAAMLQFYKCDPQDLWIIYDDVDLALGKIRIRTEGSGGSHNGMKSIVELLGFQNFPRLRIGIESRGESSGTPKDQDISDFVLHPFAKEEITTVKETVKKGANAVEVAIIEGVEKAMERFNS